MTNKIIKLDKPEFFNVTCTQAKNMGKYIYQYSFLGYILKVKIEDNDGLSEKEKGKYYSWILN